VKHHAKKQALLSVNLAFVNSVERAKRISEKDRKSGMCCNLVPPINDWTRSVTSCSSPWPYNQSCSNNIDLAFALNLKRCYQSFKREDIFQCASSIPKLGLDYTVPSSPSE